MVVKSVDGSAELKVGQKAWMLVDSWEEQLVHWTVALMAEMLV
jgi:hypothetical protein